MAEDPEWIRCQDFGVALTVKRAPYFLSELNYNASRFLQMLDEHRGLRTARILLHSPTISEGYTAMWERGRLDLTVEALIHDNSKWHPLFTEDELAICTQRLEAYGYLVGDHY